MKTPFKALDSLTVITSEFLESRDSLIEDHRGQSAEGFVKKKYTDLMDRFIFSLIQEISAGKEIPEIKEGSLAILALGSYGRRELCLGSDVDLLVIHDGPLSDGTRAIISSIPYPLWDAKLEVGQSVLTLEECDNLAKTDFPFLTSSLDARYLYGSKSFARKARANFLSGIREDKEKLFNQFLVYLKKRDEKYSEQSYFVEPDIKEGLGGLRDISFIEWTAKVYFNKQRLNQIRKQEEFNHFETDKLIRSKHFLLNVRNQLHILSGRKEDRLLLSHQKELSEVLGYRDNKNDSGSGQFMRKYYMHMNRIRWGHGEYVTKLFDILDPKPVTVFVDDLPDDFSIVKRNIVLNEELSIKDEPLIILRAMVEANKRMLFLGSGFIWKSRKILETEGKALAERPEALELFLELILKPVNKEILRLSLEIGLISLFIPEFKKIRNRALFSYYHVETVDLHSLRTMEVLESFSSGAYRERWPVFEQVFEELKHPEWLFLAALLHDIGKGYKGEHCDKGATVVPRILRRLGLEGETLTLVSFLVKNHLLLANVSQKRDLNEEKTSVQAAQTIKNTEALKLLFLLTAADSISTGPLASSDWKISLLIELFIKIKKILETGTLVSPDANKRVEKTKKAIFRKLVHDFPKKNVEDLIDQISTRYFLSTPLEDIRKHFRLALGMGEELFTWSLKKRKNVPMTEVKLCTFDKPGLFSKIVGVFVLNDIKVLSSKLFTMKNGLVIDTFDVTNPVDPFYEKQKWEKIKEEISLAIEGRLPLDQLIAEKNRRKIQQTGFIEQESRIRVDNSESDFFTILEVRGSKQIGQLFYIAEKIFSLGLDIRFAKINSDSTRMSGVFYVRDGSGQKIYDDEYIGKIKDELYDAMSSVLS